MSAIPVNQWKSPRTANTEGAQIFLTQNQVEHYQAYPHVALFLVSKIEVPHGK